MSAEVRLSRSSTAPTQDGSRPPSPHWGVSIEWVAARLLLMPLDSIPSRSASILSASDSGVSAASPSRVFGTRPHATEPPLLMKDDSSSGYISRFLP